MTDDELISILVDTDAGLAPTEGYAPAIEHVRALIGERDRLRAVAEVAVELLEEDRTSWSDYHTALDNALAAVRWVGSEEGT